MSDHDEPDEPRKRVEPTLGDDSPPRGRSAREEPEPAEGDPLEEGQALLDAINSDTDDGEGEPSLEEILGGHLSEHRDDAEDDQAEIEADESSSLSLAGDVGKPSDSAQTAEPADSGDLHGMLPELDPADVSDVDMPAVEREELTGAGAGGDGGQVEGSDNWGVADYQGPETEDVADGQATLPDDPSPQAPDHDPESARVEAPQEPDARPEAIDDQGFSGPPLPATLMAALGATDSGPAKGWRKYLPGGASKRGGVREAIPITSGAEAGAISKPRVTVGEWALSLVYRPGGIIAIACAALTAGGIYVLWSKESARPGSEVVTSANQELAAAQRELGDLSLIPNMDPLAQSWARATILIESCGLTVAAMEAGEPLDGELSTPAMGWAGQAVGPAKPTLACLWVAAQMVPMNVFDINLNGDIATIRYKVYGTQN